MSDVIVDENQDNQNRKATDILLLLEEKLTLLQKTVALYDFNIKIILDKVNKISSQLESGKAVAAMPSPSIQPTKLVNPIAPKTILIETDTPKLDIATKPITRKNIPPPVKKEDKAPIVNDTSLDVRWYNGKKVPIQQIIKDQHGKDIFMAEVSISTIDGKPMHSTKTTAVGKWQAMLAWGKYIVKIVKKDPNDPSKTYELNQEIFIPENSSPFKLKDAVLHR